MSKSVALWGATICLLFAATIAYYASVPREPVRVREAPFVLH